MGENAERVQRRLRGALSERVPADWTTEGDVRGTRVDVVGEMDGATVLVEVEWRRADPANDTAKLFRAVSEGDGDEDDVHVYQAFTLYYDLSGGGVSSKRRNAEFVGRTAAETVDGFRYTPLTLGIDPPKRGGSLGEGWRSEVKDTAREVSRGLRD